MKIKILGFIPRRTDITHAAFREYYETQHVLLALRHIRSFTKYVRNHVVDGMPQDLGFDCLPEWWFDDPAKPVEIAAWVASPEGRVLHQDEAKFMDQPHMVNCAVSERLLFGPVRDVELGVVRKIGLALTRADSASPGDFEAEIAQFGNELIRRNQGAITRVCVDVPLDPLQADLPLHTLFSVWPTVPEALINVPQAGSAIGAVTKIVFDAIETPPTALRD